MFGFLCSDEFTDSVIHASPNKDSIIVSFRFLGDKVIQLYLHIALFIVWSCTLSNNSHFLFFLVSL